MMQISVTCPLIVADELTDINGVEAEILVWGRQVMLAAFATVWQQSQARAPDWPRCDSQQTVADGQRSYRLRTAFGPGGA